MFFKTQILTKNGVENLINSLFKASVVPIISGSAALLFFKEIIFSDLTDEKYFVAVCGTVLLFVISSAVYVLLKNMERNKDQYFLSTVNQIIKSIFQHFGVSMATANAEVTAKEMNKILKTVVNLVNQLGHVAKKRYSQDD